MSFRIFYLAVTFLIFCVISTYCEAPKTIIVGSENKIININSDCEQYEIKTNYKHIQLKIEEIKNLDRVLITDKPLDSCNIKDCREDSNICQIRSVNSKSEINLDTKMCINAIYINVRKAYNVSDSETPTKYNFKVSTSYITGGSCLYIHENSFAYCGESNIEDCRNCRRPGCTVIECGMDNLEDLHKKQNYLTTPSTFVRLHDLCLPYTVTDKEKLDKCLSFSGVTTYRPTGICEYDDLDGYSSITVFIIGLAVIVVLVFSLAVIYYNVYLIKYQTAPFSVPEYLPEFLFPRSGINQKTRTTMDNTLDDVFARDNRQNF